ncbi:unnamed protein product [Prorocentrum cordatum]|uniref:Uncharacterized protein n=1 Tax=Prorocentrum cordatum TaxID=2364126 RepID=A0ABN9TS03_9DINO|nr:unnamed protein product [Polarella glacialis]
MCTTPHGPPTRSQCSQYVARVASRGPEVAHRRACREAKAVTRIEAAQVRSKRSGLALLLELEARKEDPADESINRKLRAAGEKAFTADTLSALASRAEFLESEIRWRENQPLKEVDLDQFRSDTRGGAAPALEPEDIPEQRFRVVNFWAFVREAPSLQAPILCRKDVGDLVGARQQTFDGFVKLSGEPGWLLRDLGGEHGLGRVLEPLEPELPLTFSVRAEGRGPQRFSVLRHGTGIVRAHPSEAAPIVGFRSQGDAVLIIAQTFHGWLRLDPEETTKGGWLPAREPESGEPVVRCRVLEERQERWQKLQHIREAIASLDGPAPDLEEVRGALEGAREAGLSKHAHGEMLARSREPWRQRVAPAFSCCGYLAQGAAVALGATALAVGARARPWLLPAGEGAPRARWGSAVPETNTGCDGTTPHGDGAAQTAEGRHASDAPSQQPAPAEPPGPKKIGSHACRQLPGLEFCVPAVSMRGPGEGFRDQGRRAAVLEEVPAGIIVVRHLQDGRDPLEYADPFVPSTAADSAAADLGTPVIQISDRGEHEDNHRTLRDTHGTAASQGAVARTSATKVTTANTSVVSTPATIATTTDTTVTTSTGTVVTTVTTIATLTSTRVTTTATTVATTVTTVTTSATTVATSITTAATTTDPAVTIELKPSHAEASKSNSSLSPTEHSMCSHFYDDCRDSQCCLDPHSSCFEKDEGYAACRPSCEPGVHPEEAPEKQTPWTCTLLSRGGVPAPADTTTAAAAAAARRSAELYCFVLVMAGSYEVALMENAVAKGTSVFQCDGYDVFSGEPLQLGEDVGSGRQVVATTVDGSLKVEKGGVYNTALNSAVFARLWGQVLAGGQAPKHDFTIKVDADAVFFAERVRRHLEGRSAEDSMYLNNCKDGLHGPLEIVSRKGMQDLGDGLDGCVESLKFEWDTYGEDVFLRHCLGLVGVSRVDDFGLLDETFDGTSGGDPPSVQLGRGLVPPAQVAGGVQRLLGTGVLLCCGRPTAARGYLWPCT